jgi:hypothetical protein
MTVDELISKLEWVRTHYSGGIRVELYDGVSKGYLNLDDVEFEPADEYGRTPALVRLV